MPARGDVGALRCRAIEPHRNDIPVPAFPPSLTWIGDEPAAAERLTARGPLLVLFFEVGELAGVQSLPHVEAWAERYGQAGLTTVGVHSPRSDLARDPGELSAALGRLGVDFPVAADNEYRVWHDYGCKGWPSLFLWGRGGRLRWFHLGIGGIADTEEAIRRELRAGETNRELPEPVHRPAGKGTEVVKPSDEVFPGGSHEQPWVPPAGEPLEVSYAGAGAWAALDGSGRLEVHVDGGSRPHELTVAAPGLYELSAHPRHGMHEVRLDFEGSIRVWSIAFAAGPR
jgi:hypothetical protein